MGPTMGIGKSAKGPPSKVILGESWTVRRLGEEGAGRSIQWLVRRSSAGKARGTGGSHLRPVTEHLGEPGDEVREDVGGLGATEERLSGEVP